ncbi:SprT-like domain-containing protein [Flavobacterium sp.]|uniref:SprT-like domain-containing protein n=1 Tax=Flavobacterium sp. TaxID=239 RepID=UPI0026277252|nr:SprT-like domain-containing protein [Flavobacterium sp.]
MKKVLKLSFVFWLLFACSTEQETVQQEKKQDNTITLEAFKKATGLKDFGSTIRIPKKSGGVAARNASMEDFIIDTEFIRQTLVDQKITYSFSIEPKVIKAQRTLYNLIVYYAHGSWQFSILEMKPSFAKFEQIKLGEEVKLDGEISEIYHTDTARGADCSMFSMEIRHCTHTGECRSGECDGCSLCVTYINFKVCRFDTEDYSTATYIEPENLNDGGGGGGSTPIIDHEYVFVPNFSPGNIRAIRAERAGLFYDVLTPEQQAWANRHAENYNAVINYFLDHYYTGDVGFAIEILQQMVENPELYQSINPFLIEKNIDDSELDPCAQEIISQLKNLQQTDISKIITRLGNPDSAYKIKMIADPLVENTFGFTNWSKPPEVSMIKSYFYTIKLQKNMLDHGTKLGIATTILHEMVHAYFLSLYDDYIENHDETINNFPYLWDVYVANFSVSGTALAQHNQMATTYVDSIARALQEFDTGTAVPANAEPLSLYKNLAWGGLHETIPYNNSLTPDEQAIVQAVTNAEYHNLPFSDNNNVSHIPQGSPCN